VGRDARGDELYKKATGFGRRVRDVVLKKGGGGKGGGHNEVGPFYWDKAAEKFID